MADRWTEQEDILLRDVYTKNSKIAILKIMDKPWKTILRRALRLDIHRDPEIIDQDRAKRGPRKDAWTPEEDVLLKQIYFNSTKIELMTRIKRSWKAIWSRAYSLGLRRDSTIILNEMIEAGKNAPPPPNAWTLEQINTLKEIYTENVKKDILLKLDKTWKAIRYKANSLGLNRGSDIIKRDTVAGTREAMLRNHGVEYSSQLACMKEKSRETNLRKRGVEYPTQDPSVREKCRKTVQERYGVDNVFQNKAIKDKIVATNIEKYGVANPLQNSEILKKVQETTKDNNSFSVSDEELEFYNYLKEVDPSIEHQVRHPQVAYIFDFYSPKLNLWIQYDGDYWHGRNISLKDTPRVSHILGTMERDKIQNDSVLNLVRFWDSDVKKHTNSGTIKTYIMQKLAEKKEISYECHQYRIKKHTLEKDKEELGIDPAKIRAKDFILANTDFSPEIVSFIKKYEWLGSVGVTPKWCFSARYKGLLGGVVLINEPTSYSKMIGEDTPTYEALIQRGATASWTPKNLGSRLVMFACRWVVNNTKKRLFIGYGDPKAHEIGTIYQACNFDYLGDSFGGSYLYRNPLIKNGNTFSAQTLKRTSSFRRWCKENNISIENSWIKNNGFKDITSIPLEIKQKWYTWIKTVLDQSEKFPTEKKHKYALLLYKNSKEKRALLQKKTYKKYAFPKRGTQLSSCSEDIFEGFEKPLNLDIADTPPIRRIPSKSRVTPEKIDSIINNFCTSTVKELAAMLCETERWVSSQIKNLINEGRITPKNPIGSTKSRMTPDKLAYIIANMGKKPIIQIADELQESKRWVKRQLMRIRTSHP
jgi:very-short-patch-repair endonuclease